jgi:hypothetical protein
MKPVRDERGVAMTTVLFIGAALTVLTSSAVFVTTQEFRAGTDDRKAAQALAYAEAGIDRMIDHMRPLSFGAIRNAGCANDIIELQPASIGDGTFTVTMQVFNPLATTTANRYPPGACTTVASSPRKGQYFLITSTGGFQGSRRVIQQVIRVRERGLPIGLVAEDTFDANGGPDLKGISILTEGQVLERDNLDLTGVDPYYTLEDFWPGATWGGGLTGSSPVPAAAHAMGGLKIGNKAEFPPNPNCGANKTNSNGQSLWDSDGSAGSGPTDGTKVVGNCLNQPTYSGPPPASYSGSYPPTSKFTQADYDRVAPEELSPQDHEFLRRAAQDRGLYCFKPVSGSAYCVRQGTQITYTNSPDSVVSSFLTSGNLSFIVYYEFEGGAPTSNSISFSQDVWTPATTNGCSDDLATNRSMTMVVKNGSVDLSGNLKINGAIIAEGGYFDYTGTPTINGSVWASEFRARGTANFTLDSCWVRNIPGLYITITPTQWSEIDR